MYYAVFVPYALNNARDALSIQRSKIRGETRGRSEGGSRHELPYSENNLYTCVPD